MSEFPASLLPAMPYPLGAHWDGRGTHFAVFAGHAESVKLCLFDAGGRHELARIDMPECTDGVWHGYLPTARPGQLYGYRVDGPYNPAQGHRFNSHKLLLDPYARQLAGELRWHDALYGYRIGSGRGDLSFDRRDSAAYMPKAVVTDDRFDWGDDRPPRVPWADTVVYELHVRGFTMTRGDVPEAERGTFGALGSPSVVEYLQRLGVTAVELLPVQAFVRDRRLLDLGLTNYWGYNTLGYFAPDRAYLSDGALGQMKWAVKQLHAAGIEVILDVVYNHTCEGSELGPTLSFRGFGESSYYRLLPDNPRHHVNDTGCGNTVNLSHPQVIRLVMDSLRYWVEEFHVDGFRFDLGTTLGRETNGFDAGAGFFDALLQDPLLARIKLISEPWDLGPGGYQVGQHPPRFAEWNDRFRDDVRRYWRGDAGTRTALAARLQGSAELFDHDRRRPWAGVNFVTAHDGFTLQDLVSYNAKHNQANGEDNRDGTDRNESNNWGAEGPSEDAAVIAQREKIKRAFFGTLLFAHGTPMLLAGDEFGQTQQGNNNAYCQDSAITWIDWTLLEGERGAALAQFVRRLLAVRRGNRALQGRRFQHGRSEPLPGMRDVAWFDERGVELAQVDWDNGNARVLGLRRAAARDDGTVDVILLIANADGATHPFKIPQPFLDFRVIVDSERPSVEDADIEDGWYDVAGHSLVLLAARTAPELPGEPRLPDAGAHLP
ncbi:MAG: glycogen debranching protein GlgX [Nevskia sp.]|nr:glycogen debranching protein GlgX [Nevskia sp.]